MTRFIFLTLFIFSSSLCFAQSNQWTWVSGLPYEELGGMYGIKGQSSIDNYPGCRKSSVSWKDKNGNFWVFGGWGPGENTSNYIGELNDLWKYNINTNTWTWMSGDKVINQSGIYGTKNIYSDANKPGARSSAISWIDKDGNLWMFGGTKDEVFPYYYNDLWEYNIKKNQWRWVSGDNSIKQYGNYGEKNIANSKNKPGCRINANSCADSQGNLWLFGGTVLTKGFGFGLEYNDLWKFDIQSRLWTWVSGDSVSFSKATYGTKGVESKSNIPGSRSKAVSFQDSKDNLYFFGGTGWTASSYGTLNDIWKYSISKNTWTWINGDSTTASYSSYTDKGSFNTDNKCGAREEATVSINNLDQLYLFGGWGYTASQQGPLNDLWIYDINSNQWAWIGGDTTTLSNGNYGIKGVSSPDNLPPSRSRAVSWIDNNNNFWLFSGTRIVTSNLKNDLWRFVPDGVLPLMLINLKGANTTIGNNLSWTINSSIDYKSVEIQRSLDAQNFSIIHNGLITKGKQDFNYLDQTFNKTSNNFYRLKLTGVDGDFIYSNTIKIKVADNTLITPTITHNIVTIYTGTSCEFELYSASGIRLKNLTVNGSEILDLANLQTGIYFIRNKSNGKTYKVFKY